MSKNLELLRPKDVAPLLGVTTSRIYQLIQAKQLPAIKVGGAYRIPRRAWERWLEARSREALRAASG